VRELIRELGFESQGPILMAPVTSMGEAWGILWILTEDVEIDELAMERAETVVDHAVLALENAEKYIHAKERAFIDDCTGLYNARYLYTSAENEISRSERYGSELTFVFLDLDRFKLVNDNYGHLVGSRTLRKIGEVLLSCVRQVDMVARYGGDEFTILLADTSHEGGMQVSERIREMVEETEFETDTDVPMRLTVSIGVASYPEHGEARDELLDAADKAMYHAKLMGRNKVSSIAEVLASSPDSNSTAKANSTANKAAKADE
jgi:two-component system cell cycle response regulator